MYIRNIVRKQVYRNTTIKNEKLHGMVDVSFVQLSQEFDWQVLKNTP